MSKDYINVMSSESVYLAIDAVSAKIEKSVREIKADKLNSSIEAVRIGGMRSALDLLFQEIDVIFKFKVMKNDLKDYADY